MAADVGMEAPALRRKTLDEIRREIDEEYPPVVPEFTLEAASPLEKAADGVPPALIRRTRPLRRVLGYLVAGAFGRIAGPAEVKTLRGSGKIVTVLAELKLLPGDDAKHELIVVRRLDVQRDDLVGDAQVSVVNVSDAIAGTGTNRGYRTVTTTDGDKTFVSYEGTVNAGTKAGGSPDVTFQGKWRFLGGTGKFTGLTGNGTYRGQLLPAGIAYDYEGQYEIKK